MNITRLTIATRLRERTTIAISLFALATGASAQISFTGPAFIQSDLKVSAVGGVNGVLNPAALGATNLVDVDSAPDIGGLKITALDLSYTASPIDLGKTFTISWIVGRPLTALAATATNHVNQLDGSVTYNGFNLLDISLRTITTATDTDLNALHLGPLPSGSSFNTSLVNPGFLQIVGNDHVLQFFDMQFQQVASNGTLELTLPNSASSTIASVPEPATWALALAGALLVCGVARGRPRGSQRRSPACSSSRTISA